RQSPLPVHLQCCALIRAHTGSTQGHGVTLAGRASVTGNPATAGAKVTALNAQLTALLTAVDAQDQPAAELAVKTAVVNLATCAADANIIADGAGAAADCTTLSADLATLATDTVAF